MNRYLLALATCFAQAQAADFSSCASGKLENAENCPKVSAEMDLSACGSEFGKKTVKAICWNGKRVAKFRAGKYHFTATFESQAQWGQANWKMAGINAEEAALKKPPEVAKAPTSEPVAPREPAGIIVPPAPAAAVETKPDESLKISGLMDVSYVYNFNSPRPVSGPTSTSPALPSGNNTYRTFDLYHDDINVNLAEVNFTKTAGDVTGYVALDFGTTADVLSPDDEAGKNVTEAKITYKPAKIAGLSLTAGKMMTHLGLEVTKARDNWNYSRSLLFGWAIPFWHEGLSASYSLSDKVGVTGFVYNNTADAYQTNRSKTYGAQISSAPIENLSLVYNYLDGRESDSTGAAESRTVHEINGTYQFSQSLSAGFDVVKGNLSESGDWFAWSIAARWKFGRHSLSPRFEVFEDPDGAAMGAGYGQRLMSETLTWGVDLGGGLETRVELRRDESDQKSFGEGNANKPVNSQSTGTIGLLYNF